MLYTYVHTAQTARVVAIKARRSWHLSPGGDFNDDDDDDDPFQVLHAISVVHRPFTGKLPFLPNPKHVQTIGGKTSGYRDVVLWLRFATVLYLLEFRLMSHWISLWGIARLHLIVVLQHVEGYCAYTYEEGGVLISRRRHHRHGSILS